MGRVKDAMLNSFALVNIDKDSHPEKRFNVIAMTLDNRGIPIAIDFNSYTKTHPLQAECAKKIGKETKIFLHAEIAALVRSRRQPVTLIVARVLKNGNLASARPCPACMIAIRKAGVKEIYYSNPNGTWTRDWLAMSDEGK